MIDVAFIALGSNLGDRHAYLAHARQAIASLPASRTIAASTEEETAPLGPQDQPAYLNQMLAIETELNPRALLGQLMDIERAAGRERTVRWGPRTLDLDIVMYDHQTVNEPDLHVPHLEIQHRDFWQRELAELRELITASHPAPSRVTP